MKGKRASVDQVIRTLREMVVLQVEGATVDEACRKVGDCQADVLPLPQGIRASESRLGETAQDPLARKQPTEETGGRSVTG